MRIVGGKHRGRVLKGPKTTDYTKTRPTADRVREALFNIIAPQIRGAKFLDLYAGTGAVGIEALSRGAQSLTAIEKDRYMVSVIRENLASLNEVAEVLSFDVMKVITDMGQKNIKFDIIFADPPYHLMVASKLIGLVEPLLGPGGLFIVEHSKEEVIEENVLEELKHYTYGESIISVYMRREL